MISVLAGCGRQPDARLLKAENIIQEYPDSALMILDSIEYKYLSRDDDKALYGMLITEALDKNHLNPSNDSLISFAVDYYKKKNDAIREIISLYYQGRVFFLNGDNPKAIVCYFQAKELAENSGENFWAGMACRGVSDIYNETYNASEELVYSQLSYDYMKKSGRQPYLNYALLELGKALNNNRKEDEAIAITDQLLDSLKVVDDDYLMYETRKLRLLSMLTQERFGECIELSPLVVESQFAEASDSLYYALILVRTNKLAEASKILESVSDKVSPMSKIVQFSITEKKGDYKKAYQESLSLDSIVNLELKNSLSHDLTDSLVDYFGLKEELNKAEIKNAKVKILCIVICGLFVLSILIAFAWHIHSSSEKKIIDKVNLTEQLQILLDKSNMKNQKSISIIKSLISSKYQVFEELYNLVEEKEGDEFEKRKFSRKLTKIIDGISINAEAMANLERDVDAIHDNLLTDFKKDLPSLKEADYHLFLFSVCGLTNASICLLLNEDKVEAVYNRRRRLKDKIKNLDVEKSNRYMQFF